MADGMVPVVVSPKPFGRETLNLELHEGATVLSLLRAAVKAGLSVDDLARTEIYINGQRGGPDRRAVLEQTLKAGDVVNLVVEPLGGGGGGDKDIGQILLTVAVIAVSAWVGGGASGAITSKLLARMLAAGITMVGQAVVQGMNQPKTPQKANDRYALQSASNQYRPFGPQPVALGEVVVAPDLVVKTFTESVGDDVWLYGILGLHRGKCTYDELKIGDTLVSSMGAGDVRINAHLTPGPRSFTIYPNDVDQLDLQEELQADASSATPVVRASSSDGQRFDFDFFLPKGLYFGKSDGRIESVSVSVAIRYRAVDEHGAPIGSWTDAPGWSRSGATKDPIRARHSISLPLGRYEFEVTRNQHADNNDKRHHDIFWTALKSVAYRQPVVDDQLAVIEFAVRATAINQGGLAPITCRIKPIIPVFKNGNWLTEEVSSNPAALTRWLMTGPCAAHPLTSAQADQRLRAWYTACQTYGWTAHHYLTEEKSQEEALALLEQSGKASTFWDGSQLAASVWIEKPAPKQMFTGANLRDHSFEIVYPEPVHALRVQFANIDKTGEQDEVVVYADGYGERAESGLIAATLYEALPLDGQMTVQRAYRNGRWALGQRIHQKRFDTWTTDVEHLACEYGDRVRLSITRASGPQLRVRTRRYTGELVSGVRLTDAVEMKTGVSYVVDIRTATGLYTGVPVQTTPGIVRELTFATPRAVAISPKAGDLIHFGEPDITTEDVEIVSIRPDKDLTAVLTGVRYVAPLLLAGETGPIPPVTSRLSGDRNANPPAPVFLGAQVDAHAVRVSFDLPVWRGSPISGFSVRWRSIGASGEQGAWENLPALGAGARELIAPPLREAPLEVSGVEATRAQIEIVAETLSGRVSTPMTVTVVKPVPATPALSAWSVEPREALDGISLPVLIVTGSVNDDTVSSIRIRYGLAEDGPWMEHYYGPHTGQVYEIGNLTPAALYWVEITHFTAQGVPSAHLVIGPRQAPSIVANDVVELRGEPVQNILDRLVGVEAISATNEAAVSDLGDRVDGVIAEAEDILAGANGAADLAVLKAGEANGSAQAANTAAGIATAKSDEAGDHAQAARAERLAAEAAREGSEDALSASVEAVQIATAKAGEAGDFAVASEGAATRAQNAEGNALTYREQAVQAKDDAVEASLAAGASAATAQAEAGVATQKAVEASDAASAAQISANLAAGMSINANLMPNGGGEKGTEGWSSTHPGFYTMDWPLYGGRIFKQEVVGTVPLSYIRGPDTAALPGMQITLSWRGWVEHFTGTAEVYIVFWNAAGGWVGETPRIPLNASTRKVTGTGPAGTATASMAVAFAGVGGAGGALVFARTKLEEGPDATAYTTERTDTDLQAALSITGAVAADAQSRLSSVSFDVTGGAGGAPFQIWGKAGPDGSMAGLVGTALILSNVLGTQVVEALRLVDGRAFFSAPISIVQGGRRMTLGPGFGATGDLLLWSGPASVPVGSESLDNGILGITEDDGFFGGRTLTGPFDSGASGPLIPLTDAWTTLTSNARAQRGGWYLFWPTFYHQGSGSPNGEGYAEYGVQWRVVTTNPSGGDVEVLAQGTVGQGGFGSSWGPLIYEPMTAWNGLASTRHGNRLVQLQARRQAGETASVSNYRLRGFYAV